MGTFTILIVPALTDQGGQCRIVKSEGEFKDALHAYRNRPEVWKECGLMNSRGQIVWLEVPKGTHAEIKSCEPLMAGSQFIYLKGD
jgi:hypothetical protein